MGWETVHRQPTAPAKPSEGAPCNGCGLCCLVAPCPLGILVSRRFNGACIALHWSASDVRYQCSMVTTSPKVVGWLARRWISAGTGCDARLEVQDAKDATQQGDPK